MRLTYLATASLVIVLSTALAPAAHADTNSFQGSCDLRGTIPEDRQSGDRLVQRGVCTGWLNESEAPPIRFGPPSKAYPVKVVTRTSGMSAGPLPVLQSGTGRTRFLGHRVTIRFRLEQAGLALRILGVGPSGGYGYVTPHPAGDSFDSRVEFPRRFRG